MVDSNASAIAGIAIDDSGRIVSAGLSRSISPPSLFVSRYLGAHGEEDLSFGDNGTSMPISFPGRVQTAAAVAIDHHSRILVAGSVSFPTTCEATGADETLPVVTRFNSDGTLDKSFGGIGYRGNSLWQWGDCRTPPDNIALAIDGHDRIVVTSSIRDQSSGKYSIAIIRLLEDGEEDGTFGDGGIVEVSHDASELIAAAVAIDEANRIVVAGQSVSGSEVNYNVVVYRYSENGELDSAFADGGSAEIDLSVFDAVCCMHFDSKQRIVLAGSASDDSYPTSFAARLTSDGGLDRNFGVSGVVIMPLGLLFSTSEALTVDAVDRPIIAARMSDFHGFPNHVAIAHLNEDGSFDQAVGVQGVYETALGANGSLTRSIAVDHSGRTVLAGLALESASSKGIIVRYDELFGAGFD